jgi:hypothetical protein
MNQFSKLGTIAPATALSSCAASTPVQRYAET